MGIRKLPEVDKQKLLESWRLREIAYNLHKESELILEKSKKLEREHYSEQYDTCRCCDGRGSIGEGLLIQTCGYCNSGLVPKGYYE